MDSPRAAPRYHALDGVRAFAMLLGVVLHASVPYIHVKFPWAVIDASQSISLTLVIYAIHAFRMPAFFLIAGFFARLVFLRGDLAHFVRHRGQRILLPLLGGWLLIHPTMRTVWVWSGVRAMDNSGPEDLWNALATVFSPEFAFRGLGFMHLWFLYYLLVLYTVFLLARAVAVRLDHRHVRIRDADGYLDRLVRSRWAAVLLAVPTTWVLLLMRGWGVDFVDRSLVPRPAHVMLYGMFFTFGWMLHRTPDLLRALRDRWKHHTAVALVLLVPLVWQLYLVYTVHHQAGPWFRLAYFMLYGCMVWSFVLAMLGAFQRFFDQPSRWWRYLADASYWIYIVHLPLVIAIAVILREVPMPWYVKLPLVLLGATPVLLGSYHLLVRSTWIGVVLNGRRLPLRRAPET